MREQSINSSPLEGEQPRPSVAQVEAWGVKSPPTLRASSPTRAQPLPLQGGAIFFIRLYRYLLSPLKPACCRYLPTCSDYAVEAIHTHGILRGGGLTLRRLLSCHPWGGSGFDPVPSKEPLP